MGSENKELRCGEKLLGILKSPLIFFLQTEVRVEIPVESHAVVKEGQRAPRCLLPVSPTQSHFANPSATAPPGTLPSTGTLPLTGTPPRSRSPDLIPLSHLNCAQLWACSISFLFGIAYIIDPLQSLQFITAKTPLLGSQLLLGGGLTPGPGRRDVN